MIELGYSLSSEEFGPSELLRNARAGFDGVYIHQVGPNQDAFFDFCARELLPAPVGAS